MQPAGTNEAVGNHLKKKLLKAIMSSRLQKKKTTYNYIYYPQSQIYYSLKKIQLTSRLWVTSPKAESGLFDHTCEGVHTCNGEICDKYCVTFLHSCELKLNGQKEMVLDQS